MSNRERLISALAALAGVIFGPKVTLVVSAVLETFFLAA